KNNFFPVRILEGNNNEYRALILANNKKISIYEYQLKTYGYHHIYIADYLLERLGFERDGFNYRYKDIIVCECLIGELQKDDYPFYLYQLRTKHLGYAILNINEILEFQEEYKKIEFDAKNHKIKEKYFFTSRINEVFTHLIKKAPDEFTYEMFDKIFQE